MYLQACRKDRLGRADRSDRMTARGRLRNRSCRIGKHEPASDSVATLFRRAISSNSHLLRWSGLQPHGVRAGNGDEAGRVNMTSPGADQHGLKRPISCHRKPLTNLLCSENHRQRFYIRIRQRFGRQASDHFWPDLCDQGIQAAGFFPRKSSVGLILVSAATRKSPSRVSLKFEGLRAKRAIGTKLVLDRLAHLQAVRARSSCSRANRAQKTTIIVQGAWSEHVDDLAHLCDLIEGHNCAGLTVYVAPGEAVAENAIAGLNLALKVRRFHRAPPTGGQYCGQFFLRQWRCRLLYWTIAA